ncbi:hypothetical protein Tco_1154967 [Tanacetum coccineum]
MLKKFGLEDSKPMKTPMSSDTKLTKEEECELVDSTKYQGMIEDPKTSHLEVVKRIFRYIKDTMHLGLWYPKGTDIETMVYADSDRKQTVLAISTTEAEYISAGKACPQALWMKQALIDYDIRLEDVSIMCDNKGAIDLSKNLRKTRKDYGTRRGRSSTSSSSAFSQSSSSHLNDDDNDGNDEGNSRASTPSPTHFVNSLSNDIPQIFSNPPNIDPNMEEFYTRQTEILNRQSQLRDEQCGGIRSIGKGIKNLWRKKKK